MSYKIILRYSTVNYKTSVFWILQNELFEI